VLDAWQNRDNAEFSAKEESFTTGHRVKIFEGCRVAFIGFPENEKANMVDLLRSYNGIETASDDDTCTHKVSLTVDYIKGIIASFMLADTSIKAELKRHQFSLLIIFVTPNLSTIHWYPSNIIYHLTSL